MYPDSTTTHNASFVRLAASGLFLLRMITSRLIKSLDKRQVAGDARLDGTKSTQVRPRIQQRRAKLALGESFRTGQRRQYAEIVARSALRPRVSLRVASTAPRHTL